MDPVAEAQINLTQAEADARKAAIKAEAEREPVDEDEHESACVRAIHDVLMEEEAAVEELEEIEEEGEEQLEWQEERVAKLETELATIREESNSHHSELISKFEELKLKPLIPPSSPPMPSLASVNPAAIPEPKGSDVPVVEPQRRKVRKI